MSNTWNEETGKHLTFGQAFDIIRGSRVKGMRLPTWSRDVVIRVQFPNNKSKMTAPYLYVQSRYGRVPWKETMIELFSTEWEIVEDADALIVPKKKPVTVINTSATTTTKKKTATSKKK